MWTSCPVFKSNSTQTSSSPPMEDLWRDITLQPDLPRHGVTGVILQDFFSNNDTAPVSASPTPPTPAALALNSLHPQSASLNVALEAAAGRKRFADLEPNSGDRRHKRMIKNRESAARSRARKQAYTNELEMEVAQLVAENARLREQQQQLLRAAAAQNDNNNNSNKKKPLQRSLTAPF